MTDVETILICFAMLVAAMACGLIAGGLARGRAVAEAERQEALMLALAAEARAAMPTAVPARG